MADLADLLDSAGSAARRHVNLRGRLRIWRHQGRINSGFERWTVGAGGSGQGRRGARMTFRSIGPSQSEESEHAIQVVARWPERWRLEGDWFGGGPDLTVFDGPAWMNWSKDAGARTNFGDPSCQHGNPASEMLDPAPLLRSDIDGLVAGQVAGRPTWHLRAQPQDRQRHHERRWAWEHCIDDYQLDMDREYGLVTKLVGRVSGEDAIRYEFEQLELGIDVEDASFAMVAPDGSQPLDARR